MLTVVTTATRDYSRPWIFPSLGMLGCRVECLLSEDDSRPLPVNVTRVPYVTPGCCYQNGHFLDAMPWMLDNDILVLADADGVFQRDFSPAELQTLNDLDDLGFAIGYNVRPGQRGAEEYAMLRPKQPIEEAAVRLDLPLDILRGAWIYNTGLIAGRVAAWRRLRSLYARTVGDHGPGMFHLHSWMQYFICLTFCVMGIPITELGFETHSHGHTPLTPKHRIERRQLWYDGGLVLYAHAVGGVTH